MTSKTRTTFTSLLSAAALALTLSACDSDTKKTETKVTKKTETTVEKKTEVKDTTKKDDTKVVAAVPDAPKPEDTTPPADSPAGKVQLAAAVAKEISVSPETADDILGKHGLDRSKFDSIMFEIAGDPELTRAYMAARKTT